MPKPNKREYGDSFLYAEDLVSDGKWVSATLTIKSVIDPNTITGDNGKVVEKRCLTFEGKDKIYAMPATAERVCKMNFGTKDYEKWVGKTVTVYPTLIDAFGEKDVPCVRIRTQKKQIPFAVRKQLGRDLTGTPVI